MPITAEIQSIPNKTIKGAGLAHKRQPRAREADKGWMDVASPPDAERLFRVRYTNQLAQHINGVNCATQLTKKFALGVSVTF